MLSWPPLCVYACTLGPWLQSNVTSRVLCREQQNVRRGHLLMLKTECSLFGVVETMTVLRNRAAGKQRDAVILAFRCVLAHCDKTQLMKCVRVGSLMYELEGQCMQNVA